MAQPGIPNRPTCKNIAPSISAIQSCAPHRRPTRGEGQSWVVQNPQRRISWAMGGRERRSTIGRGSHFARVTGDGSRLARRDPHPHCLVMSSCLIWLHPRRWSNHLRKALRRLSDRASRRTNGRPPVAANRHRKPTTSWWSSILAVITLPDPQFALALEPCIELTRWAYYALNHPGRGIPGHALSAHYGIVGRTRVTACKCRRLFSFPTCSPAKPGICLHFSALRPRSIACGLRLIPKRLR